MAVDAKQWPLDFSGLCKGDVISTEQLQKIFEPTRPTDAAWALSVLKLRSHIKHHRPDLVTKADGHTVRVLHDDEIPERAVDYVRKGLALIAGAGEILETPITESLTDAQLRFRESATVAVVAIQQDAMSSAAKHRNTFAAIRARQLPEKSKS